MHTYIHTPPCFMHPDTIKCEHSFNMMQTQTQILKDIIKWLPFYCKHGLFSFFPLVGWDFFLLFIFSLLFWDFLFDTATALDVNILCIATTISNLNA